MISIFNDYICDQIVNQLRLEKLYGSIVFDYRYINIVSEARYHTGWIRNEKNRYNVKSCKPLNIMMQANSYSHIQLK